MHKTADDHYPSVHKTYDDHYPSVHKTFDDHYPSVHALTCFSTSSVFIIFSNYFCAFSWSFGVTMWELVTVGGVPYVDISPEELYTQLQSGMRMSCPPHCALEV